MNMVTSNMFIDAWLNHEQANLEWNNPDRRNFERFATYEKAPV